MASEASNLPDGVEEVVEDKSTTSEKKKTFFGRFFTKKWIVIIVGVSVLFHGLGFTYYKLRGAKPEDPAGEVCLGVFHFEAPKGEVGTITRAEFSVYIELLEGVDEVARQRLAARRFRVQQGIEELLRQAHSGDFDTDPILGGLKRQFKEQINDILGIMVIRGDVIITNQKLDQNEAEAETDVSPTTAGKAPWKTGQGSSG